MALRAPLSAEIALARAAAGLSRLAGAGGGTTVPGKLLWKLDPGAVDRLAARLPQGSALISATNGKTTTAAMAAADPVARGAAGAQRLRARTSSRGSPPPCSPPAAPSWACSRSTRRRCRRWRAGCRPRAVCLGNLFRDQLDRYGELELVAARWREAVSAPSGRHRARRERRRPARSATSRAGTRSATVFGLDDPRHASPVLQHAADSKWCVRCGTPYVYAAAYIGHLGDYRCPACGHARPHARRGRPRGRARRPRERLASSSSRRRARAGSSCAVPGLYNVYNALAAAALARALGVGLDEIVAGSQGFSARLRPLRADRARRPATLLLLLIKNPAGANEVVRTLVAGGPPRRLLIALNDEIADGRDVSWIWDVDFEPLLGRARAARRVRRAGGRAGAALQVRAASPEQAIEVVPELERGARPRARADAGGLRARRAAHLHGDARAAGPRRRGRGLVRPYWERGGVSDPRRAPLPGLPEHLRRPRQHRRARPPRGLARARARGRRRSAPATRCSPARTTSTTSAAARTASRR